MKPQMTTTINNIDFFLTKYVNYTSHYQVASQVQAKYPHIFKSHLVT